MSYKRFWFKSERLGFLISNFESNGSKGLGISELGLGLRFEVKGSARTSPVPKPGSPSLGIEGALGLGFNKLHYFHKEVVLHLG